MGRRPAEQFLASRQRHEVGQVPCAEVHQCRSDSCPTAKSRAICPRRRRNRSPSGHGREGVSLHTARWHRWHLPPGSKLRWARAGGHRGGRCRTRQRGGSRPSASSVPHGCGSAPSTPQVEIGELRRQAWLNSITVSRDRCGIVDEFHVEQTVVGRSKRAPAIARRQATSRVVRLAKPVPASLDSTKPSGRSSHAEPGCTGALEIAPPSSGDVRCRPPAAARAAIRSNGSTRWRITHNLRRKSGSSHAVHRDWPLHVPARERRLDQFDEGG